jgi:uncharacterized membrane protein YjfL (UPF0719 family)
MNIKRSFLTALTIAGAALYAPAALAADALPAESWHAKTLGEALGLTALFSLVGVALAVIGYKLFDRCTPGDLHKEILENKNVAAAIVAAAVILGVCVIIAAAIMG